MKTILIFVGICCVGFVLSKCLLDIFDRICYIFLELCIRFGNDWIQSKITKILGA